MLSGIKKIKLLVLAVIASCAINLNGQVGFKLSTSESVIEVASLKKDTMTIDGKKDSVYRTLSLIGYERINSEISPIKKLSASMTADLDQNSRDPLHLYPDDVFKRKRDSVAMLNAMIGNMEDQKDSLYFQYVSEYVDYRKVTFCPGILRARAVFDVVYGNEGQRFKAMGNSGVQFGASGTASIYSEVISGNMGLIRVGFGTMLTSDDSGNDSTSQTDQAYQRLITNGGNTILTLEYPLLYANGFNNQLNAIIRPIVKGTADLPAFGTSTDKWAGSIMFGLDAYGDAALDNNQLRFFANISSFYVRGTSVYQSNLAVASPDFSFGQLTLGLVFLENFKISIIVATWSTQADLRNRNVIIGGQVLR